MFKNTVDGIFVGADAFRSSVDGVGALLSVSSVEQVHGAGEVVAGELVLQHAIEGSTKLALVGLGDRLALSLVATFESVEDGVFVGADAVGGLVKLLDGLVDGALIDAWCFRLRRALGSGSVISSAS